MCETVDHVQIIDDIAPEDIHEEIMEIFNNPNQFKKQDHKDWYEFYNEQSTETLINYLAQLVVINGKFCTMDNSNERDLKILRILPKDLFKLGFSVPKDLNKVENIIRSVVRAIRMRYAHSNNFDIYNHINVELKFDVINNPENPFWFVIVNKIGDTVIDTLNVDKNITNDITSLKAVLVSYSFAQVNKKNFLIFDIPDSTSQARAVLNYRPVSNFAIH